MRVPTPRQLPSGSWYIQLRLGGESIPITTATRRDCVNQAQIIKADYLAGRSIKKKTLPPAPEMTLRELIDAYIQKYKPVLSPSTVRGYCVIRDNRFQTYIDTQLRDLPDWQQIVNEEAGKCAAKTLKSAWSLVRSSLIDAGQPAPTVALPPVPGKERPFLTAEEVRRLVAAVHGSQMEIPVLLGLHGLRRSEIAALDWRQVDLKAGTIRVEGALVPNEAGEYVKKATTKTDASRRTVPIMIPELRAALEAVSKSDRTGPVVRCHINSIYKAVNSICKREGLPQIGAHGLRHSFASLGHYVGVPEHEMQILGGWKDAGTMKKIYEHIEKDALLRSENAIAKFFAPPFAEQNAHENAHDREKC